MNKLLKPEDAEQGLGVLQSTLPVVESARHVWIDNRALADLREDMIRNEGVVEELGSRFPWCNDDLKMATAILVLNAWNFCFWPDRGRDVWSIEHQGKEYKGYKALAFCVERALAEGLDLTDPKCLKKLTQKKLKTVFRGKGEIPMLAERTENAREIGEILMRDWEGDFVNLLKAAEGSAVSFVELIVAAFPSFDDVGIYYGREVKFYKKAQILAADLMRSLSHQPLLNFHDAHQLSAFADYKVPQILEARGVLRYSPQLQALLSERECLPKGDPLEMEIRACMVWAVEALREALAERGKDWSALEVGARIWELGRTLAQDLRPYHRTRTIFY